MIKRLYEFACADCPTAVIYQSRDDARAKGWATARDGKTCYCPACALKHRNVGRRSLKITGEQIGMWGA